MAWPAPFLTVACQAPPPPPRLQRLISEARGEEYGDAIRRAQQAEILAGGGVRVGWEFAGSGAEKDWSVLGDVKGLRRVGGRLQGRVTGVDPATAALVKLSTAKTDSLWLRMTAEHGGTGQVFWATEEDPVMTEEKSLTFAVPLSTHAVDQLLAVGAHPDWKGNLIALRIDMPPTNGEFGIDFVRIVGPPTRPPSVIAELRRRAGKATIDGVSCPVWLSPPPDELSWEVEIGRESVLRFSYGLLPESWPLAASSARFSVTATSLRDGESRAVFTRELRLTRSRQTGTGTGRRSPSGGSPRGACDSRSRPPPRRRR